MRQVQSPTLHLYGTIVSDSGEAAPVDVMLCIAENPRKQKGLRVQGHVEFPQAGYPPDPLTTSSPPHRNEGFSTRYLTAGSIALDRQHQKLSIGLSFPGKDLRGYRLVVEKQLPRLLLPKRPTHKPTSKPQHRPSGKIFADAVLGNLIGNQTPLLGFFGVISESGAVLHRVTLRVDILATFRSTWRYLRMSAQSF